MLAEEAVRIVEVGRKDAGLLEFGGGPGGRALLVAVAVGEVVHELPVMAMAPMVNLPEDDAAPPGGSQAVALSGVAHLGLGQIAGCDYGAAELGCQGEGTLNEVGR